jgi:mannose/fructose/N-acetylgalactosamine-specific phosphotransferase system component IIB
MLLRVDDRLVHGQVVVAWGERLHPRRIVVADDAAAVSGWERELLASAAPGVEVRVMSLGEAAQGFAAEAAADGPAILLMRDLQAALELARRGVALGRLNLGGLHYAPGKQKVNDYLYLDAADREAVRELRAAGVVLEVQDVPAARPVPLADLGVSEAR